MDLSNATSREARSGSSAQANDSSLLLELGVPFRVQEGRLQVEAQALNGIRRWAEHFERITVLAPALGEAAPLESTVTWADPATALDSSRIRLEPLPWAYAPAEYFRVREAVRKRLRPLITSHRYLCFSNLGSFGAWGNLAAAEARRAQRPYSLWFDWVVHRMHTGKDESMKQVLKAQVDRSLAFVNTYWAVRGCALGLFHGKTVYDAYAPVCRQPAIVHDVHVAPEQAASEATVVAKLHDIEGRSTLRLGYAGRVHPMKDPLAWVEVMMRLCALLGPERMEATWVGDGPLLDSARQRVRAAGLEETIRFPGHLENRESLLSFLRGLDLFVFCHVTPESPRCLIEALISATPIVGYESEYARDLVAERGGGVFTRMHDVEALAGELHLLATHRQKLANLIRSAAANRPYYSDVAVFAHRSELIKRYLP